jgi:hypothetical protein
MKHKLKMGGILALALFLVYLYGCQKEELESPKFFGPDINSNNGINYKYVKGNSIPNVIDVLNAQMRKSGKLVAKHKDETYYQTMNTSFGVVLFDNIMQVVDSLGNSNYTFKVIHPEDNYKTFFNLVMLEKEQGVKVQLIKYEMSEEFANLYRQGAKDLSQFVGSITTNTLTSPCLCEDPNDGLPIEVNPGDNGDGGSGGGGSGNPIGGPTLGSPGDGGSGGGNQSCVISIITTVCCQNIHWGYSSNCRCPESGGNNGATFMYNSCTGQLLQLNKNSRFKKGNTQNQTENINENDCCNNGLIGILDPSSKEEDMIEERINDFDLDPCSKTILSQLKNLQQNDISKILQRFNNVPYVYNLTYKTATPLINPLNSAETDWVRDLNDNPVLQNYLIHINPNYVNQATKIAIARTILHEMLHAHLLAIVDDIGLANSIVDPREFPVIYNAISNNIQSNTEAIHHQQMSMKYILPLRDALKEWDNSNQPDQYYEDLAWGALYNTSTFNFYHPQGSISRQRIIARNQAEDTNSVVNTPTVSYTPLGTGC